MKVEWIRLRGRWCARQAAGELTRLWGCKAPVLFYTKNGKLVQFVCWVIEHSLSMLLSPREWWPTIGIDTL